MGEEHFSRGWRTFLPRGLVDLASVAHFVSPRPFLPLHGFSALCSHCKQTCCLRSLPRELAIPTQIPSHRFQVTAFLAVAAKGREAVMGRWNNGNALVPGKGESNYLKHAWTSAWVTRIESNQVAKAEATYKDGWVTNSPMQGWGRGKQGEAKIRAEALLTEDFLK